MKSMVFRISGDMGVSPWLEILRIDLPGFSELENL